MTRGKLFLIGFSFLVTGFLLSEAKVTSNVRVVDLEETSSKEDVDGWIETLEVRGVKFPWVVLAQACKETAWFSSVICNENRNLFGMKHNHRGWSTGKNRGHAQYKYISHSIADYQQWQERMLKLKPCKTESDYYDLLDNLPICGGCRYAEDPAYTQSLRVYVAQLHAISESQ